MRTKRSARTVFLSQSIQYQIIYFICHFTISFMLELFHIFFCHDIALYRSQHISSLFRSLCDLCSRKKSILCSSRELFIRFMQMQYQITFSNKLPHQVSFQSSLGNLCHGSLASLRSFFWPAGLMDVETFFGGKWYALMIHSSTRRKRRVRRFFWSLLWSSKGDRSVDSIPDCVIFFIASAGDFREKIFSEWINIYLSPFAKPFSAVPRFSLWAFFDVKTNI